MTTKQDKGDVFRQCAAAMVFRPQRVCTSEGCFTTYQFLLVHKPRKRDAWQLPQGGVEEGETVEEAALRELHEEAGIEAEALQHSGKSYQYTFPSSYRRYRPDHVCGQSVQFVFAMLKPGQRVKVDNREIDRHAWVTEDRLPQYLKREAYLDIVQSLAAQSHDVLREYEQQHPSSSV